MNEILILTMVLGVGLLLGVFFFGGLWWTTHKGIGSKFPVLWFFGSLILRIGITLTAMYYISQNHWERMIVCLAGFIIARVIIIRFIKFPTIAKVALKNSEP